MVKRNLATSELCRGKRVCCIYDILGRVQWGMAPFARVTTSETTATAIHRRETGPRGKWARLSTCTRREGIQVEVKRSRAWDWIGLDGEGRNRGTRNGGQPTFGRRKPEFATAMPMPMPMRRRQHNFAKRGRAQLWLEERHFTTSTGYQTESQRVRERGRESQNCHASVCLSALLLHDPRRICQSLPWDGLMCDKGRSAGQGSNIRCLVLK